MTPIDRNQLDMWRQIAVDAGDDPYANTLHPDEVIALLDALTRAEAQSETRRLNVAYWQERAEQFEVAEEQLLLRNRNLLDAHREARARIQAVDAEIERHEKHLGLDPLIPANRIRRALDAPECGGDLVK